MNPTQPVTRVKRDLSLRDVLLILKRQKLTMVVIFVLCLGAGAVAYKITRPTFRSSVRVLIESPVGAVDDQNKGATASADSAIGNQIAFIEEGFMVEQLNRMDPINVSKTAGDPARPRITAVATPDTNVLTITVESSNPRVPELVGNAIPAAYETLKTEQVKEAVDNAGNSVNNLLAKYQERYRTALKKLDQAKSSRALPALDGEAAIRAGRVTATQGDVEAKEAEVAAQEKLLATVEGELAALPKRHKNITVSANVGAIEAQKALLKGLEADRASKLTVWKEGTPEIKKIDAEIEQQRQRLAEIPTVLDQSDQTEDPLKQGLIGQIAGDKASLAAAKTRLAKAQDAAAKALTEFETYSKLEPSQTKLTTEVAEARAQLLQAEQNFDGLKIKQYQQQQWMAPLGSPSPAERIRPILNQYVVVAVLGGLIFALGFALLKDYVEDKVTSADDVFLISGLEPLAQMPRVPALTAPISASTSIARIAPSAELFDSYRLLRFNLLNAAERGYMGSLVITSATGSEGKSDLAADLASVMAGSGRRVVLVDANLRHPSVAPRFGLNERPGMTDVLIGEAELEQAIVPTNVPGLHVLPAGAKTTNPVDLLESAQMVSLHARLREMADLVIFDAPSCLTYADVSVLASFTDSVIVVAELGTTKRALLSRGVNMLQRSSARLVGVVLRDHQPSRRRGKRKAA